MSYASTLELREARAEALDEKPEKPEKPVKPEKLEKKEDPYIKTIYIVNSNSNYPRYFLYYKVALNYAKRMSQEVCMKYWILKVDFSDDGSEKGVTHEFVSEFNNKVEADPN